MFFFYFFFISFSLIGYGYLISNFFKIDNKEFGHLGILGLIFLAAISYSSTLFIVHDYSFNLSILFFGLILFFYFFKIKKNNFELLKFLIVFIILIIFILVSKNHDDFGYYHFPYAIFLTEFSHPIGFGQFNNGFRSPSSLFFISSIFYLPKVSYNLFHIAPALILGFSNLILLNRIFSKKNFDINSIESFLSLITLIFINIFFYRLAEHGTDRSGMILIMISIIYISSTLNITNKKIIIENIKFTCILICFVITIKPFYLIYFPLILIFLINKETYKSFFELLISKTSIFCIFLIFLTFFFTFINSGCLVFPLTFTCFENLSWAIDRENVDSVNKWFELWSKAGATPNIVVDDREKYVTNLNWLSNWFNTYFFNKVSDFILGVTFLSLIYFFTFYKKNKFLTFNKNLFSIYFYVIFALIEWFLNHPSLRYGGYHLIALLLFLPLCDIISNMKIQRNEFIKKATILILITFIIFLGRNLIRLNKEYNHYAYNPFNNPNFKFIGGDKKFYFRYNEIMSKNMLSYDKVNFFGKTILVIKKSSKKSVN